MLTTQSGHCHIVKMKHRNSIRSQIDELTNLLIEAGHEDRAKKLSQLKILLEDDTQVAAALAEITGLCHIKAYGDLNMPNMSGWDWLTKLGKLKSTCQRMIKTCQ